MRNIQFTAANGFPAKTYEHIFAQIEKDKLNYINIVGNTIPKNTGQLWFSIADEIIASIEANFTTPVIGMGHSLGGTCTYIAACKRPDLFSRLILTEPIAFKPHFSFALRALHLFDKKHAFAQQAAIRKHKFNSREAARSYLKTKPFFTGFSKESFDAYLEHALEPTEPTSKNKLQLAFSREKESLIFSTIPKISHLKTPSFPVDIVIGKRSNLLSKFDLPWWQRRVGANLHYYDGGHMLCFEDPEGFAQLINSFLNNEKTSNK